MMTSNCPDTRAFRSISSSLSISGRDTCFGLVDIESFDRDIKLRNLKLELLNKPIYSFDQMNEYLTSKDVDINIVEYISLCDDLISRNIFGVHVIHTNQPINAYGGIVYKAIETLIRTVEHDYHAFCISIDKLSELGIDIEQHYTIKNRIKLLINNQMVSKLDNQLKTLKKMRLIENVDFCLVRTSIDVNGNREFAPLEYRLNRATYMKCIEKKVNSGIISDIAICLSSLISYYNLYRDKITLSRLSILKKSILDVSSEVTKLATIAEELNSRDSSESRQLAQTFISPTHAHIGTNTSDHDSPRLTTKLRHTAIGYDNERVVDSYTDTRRSRGHQNTSSMRIRLPRDSIRLRALDEAEGIEIGSNRKILLDVSNRDRSMTELVLRPSNKDLIMDCIGLHRIHSKFKKVARDMEPAESRGSDVYNNRISIINDELFNINKQIDAIIDSIEYSESV